MLRKFTLVAWLFLLSLQLTYGQSFSVTGRIIDSDSADPLVGVNAILVGTGIGAASDMDGRFTIPNVAPGRYTLRLSSLGFATIIRSINVVSNLDLGTLQMSPDAIMGQEVVVSASRRPERITDAPAAIDVITSRDISKLPSFNVGELFQDIQGLEIVRSGVIGIGINARGFNSAFNVRMLSLNDGRNGMLPGGTGLPAGFYNTIIKEDIERIEVILGPASALYGPNAHAGVVNTITKDPRTSEGTTVALGAGNQAVLSGRLRHAKVVNDKFAYKVNFEYTEGRDFEFIDSVYIAGIGAVPEFEPNFNFKAVRANAAVYYSVTKDADIIVDYGIGQGSNIGVTNLGRNQINDWTFSYLHARYVSPRVFAQLYNTWNDAGNTYQINGRTTNYHRLLAQGKSSQEARELSLLPADQGGISFPGFKDESHRVNGEIQYNNTVGKLDYIVGASFQRDVANSLGTYLFDRDGAIVINQFGAVAQLDYSFTNKFKFVGAARVDKHDYYDVQFSPRMALTYAVGNGTFRTTYGRAYAAPSIQFLEFLFPFAGGAIIGSGQGLTLQNFATGERRIINPLQPETNQTFEFGYRGNPVKKLFFDATAWYGKSRNFISPAVPLFLGSEFIVERGGVPLAPDLGNLHITYINYGEVNNWGVDLGFNYMFTEKVGFGAKYSHFGSDITNEEKFADDPSISLLAPATREALRVLNAPANRASFNLNATNLADNKLDAVVRVRWVPEFDFRSGNQIATAAGEGSRVAPFLYNRGPLGGFTTVDVSSSYKFSKMVHFGAGITNLFDVEQREYVGSPNIGRLYSVELKFNF